jgi:hypothetical protein
MPTIFHTYLPSFPNGFRNSAQAQPSVGYLGQYRRAEVTECAQRVGVGGMVVGMKDCYKIDG